MLTLADLFQNAERIDPTKWHTFTPRKHGSRKACDICGGRYEDPIHIHPPKPPRKT